MEEDSQLELVVDFLDPSFSDKNDLIHSVEIDFSHRFLECHDTVCAPVREETDNLVVSMAPHVPPKRKQPVPSISDWKKDMKRLDIQYQTNHCNQMPSSGKGTQAIVPNPGKQELSTETLGTTCSTHQTEKKSTMSVARILDHRGQSRERGWNQYCAGANVPGSFKRNTHTILGRFKKNPALENCYITPRENFE